MNKTLFACFAAPAAFLSNAAFSQAGAFDLEIEVTNISSETAVLRDSACGLNLTCFSAGNIPSGRTRTFKANFNPGLTFAFVSLEYGTFNKACTANLAATVSNGQAQSIVFDSFTRTQSPAPDDQPICAVAETASVNANGDVRWSLLIGNL